jgi:hypothetical protein
MVFCIFLIFEHVYSGCFPIGDDVVHTENKPYDLEENIKNHGRKHVPEKSEHIYDDDVNEEADSPRLQDAEKVIIRVKWTPNLALTDAASSHFVPQTHELQNQTEIHWHQKLAGIRAVLTPEPC